jgi:hypothetical protein
MQSAFGNGGRFFVPANPVARIFKETANDSSPLYARSRAVEGHRSPRREALADDSRTARSVLECASPLALSNRRLPATRFSTYDNPFAPDNFELLKKVSKTLRAVDKH